MLRQSLRPLARAASSRAYSTAGPSSGFSRSAVLASLTLTAGGLAYASSQRGNLLCGFKETVQGAPDTVKNTNVRESVLDQKSLKESIHKKAPAGDKSSPAPEVVEKKAEEAKEPAQSAFNEETGEINWDCPCLGGMADGPCGESFKAAFSCFVYSEKEPKGIECVEKFKDMQDCFRQHPDIYGEEIDDDEDESPAEDPRPKAQQKHGARSVTHTPPENNPSIGTTPETTPAKGIAKLVPSKNRTDFADNYSPKPPPGGQGGQPSLSPEGQRKGKGMSEAKTD